jgi:hypothetical protein
VAVERETPAKGRDVLPGHLIYNGIHEFAGINLSTEQRAVATKL